MTSEKRKGRREKSCCTRAIGWIRGRLLITAFFIFLRTVGVISLFFCTSCPLPFFELPGTGGEVLPPAPEAAPAGMGYFSLSISPPTALTILPTAPVFATYKLSFVPNIDCDSGNEDLDPIYIASNLPGITTTVPLRVGIWNLKVEAYTNDVDEDNPPADNSAVASGSLLGFIIGEGGITSRTVTLNPIETGKGTFNWTINYPSGVTMRSATMNIKLRASGVTVESETLDITGASASGETPLDAGYYDVEINLESSEGKKTAITPVLHIQTNMVSEYTHTFTAFNFSGSHDPSTETVTIEGNFFWEGEELSVNIDNLVGSGTIYYMWYRGTTLVGTGETYTITAADTPGTQISVEAYRAGYNGSITSAAVTVQASVTVTFNSNGGSDVAPITNVVSGTTIAAPADPTTTAGGATLNRFRGWYTDNNTFANAFDFNTPITDNITLFADWGYRVGDTGPGTGIIFHRVDAGFTVEGYTGGSGSFAEYTAHYLEAAPSNSGSGQWGNYGTVNVSTFTTTTDPLYNKIGNGRKDTQIIIAHLGTNESGKAAQLAGSAEFGDQTDWFLPSSGELNLLYGKKSEVGMGSETSYFWSSSQYDSSNAWFQYFANGNQGTSDKDDSPSVRAVRAFGEEPTPTYTVTSITADYTQTGTFFTSDDLDNLKNNLIVTAFYNDGSEEELSDDDYALSGTLVAGTTNTITVTYEGRTATFTLEVGEISEPDFAFTLNANGTYTIGSSPSASGDIVIPGWINGIQVTTIAAQAFYGNTNVESVTISEGVTNIGNFAFRDCSSLTSVVIPESLVTIGNNVFENCSSLTSVVFPEGVETIGNNVFLNCSTLTSVVIPKSVTSIGTNVFQGCNSFTSIEVNSDNPSFTSDDGILYNKDKTVIITFPAGKNTTEFEIPASVTSIGQYAFRGCSNLTNVVIPPGVTIIGQYAFENCTRLTSVEIPEGVTSRM